MGAHWSEGPGDGRRLAATLAFVAVYAVMVWAIARLIVEWL